jgi:DNA-binding transcriptional LysR family regulator
MELRHLRYFIAIAEEGSFTRAAARLGIQQPPLSQQLRALEGELGATLFRRHARGVELTAAGESFLVDARALVAAAGAAARRAARVASGEAGLLTLGLATSASSHQLAPHVIREFRKRRPAVALTFIDGNAAALTEAVQERRVHVALVRASVARPQGLRQESLLEEPLLVAIPRSHALMKRRRASIALGELRDEAFILVRRPGAPGMYGDLVAACRRAGFDPRIATEVGNMFVNTMLVAAGVGVSVVPASMAQSYAGEVAYVPIRGAPELVAPLTLVFREEEANPAALEFLALARKLAR